MLSPVIDPVETGINHTLVEHAVLACIADGVIVNDVGGMVTMVNRAAGRLLRADPRALVGMPVRQLFQSFSSTGRLTMLDALERLQADPYSYEPGEGITETMLEVGLQVIQANLSPVLTEDGEFVGIVTVLRDITREVESERAKSDFVTNVSHELRTPLTSIVGYTSFLLNRAMGPLTEQQENFVRIIHSNGQRLVTLVNDILDASRIESGRLELNIQPVHLDVVAREVIDMFKPQSEQKRLELTLDMADSVRPVLGDAMRLAQVLTNLVSNACRYTPADGQITVSITCPGDSVRVDVTDTGIGIEPDDQVKIFQRFYRVSSAASFECNGTGLGLPITKMLVEMHGGRLWVNSTVGKGSTFTFVLPAQAQPIEEITPVVTAPASASSGQVLIVEGDPKLAHTIALHLQREGFVTKVASSGNEALELAQQDPIDLITLDMILPDLGGMEVLRRLKTGERTRAVPVVIISVLRDDQESVESAFELGARPFALEKLVENVRRTLAAKQTH